MGAEQIEEVSEVTINSIMGIVKDNKMNASDVKIYIAIVFLVENGYKNMKRERIAELTNLNDRTVTRAILTLKKAGYIKTIPARYDQEYIILK